MIPLPLVIPQNQTIALKDLQPVREPWCGSSLDLIVASLSRDDVGKTLITPGSPTGIACGVKPKKQLSCIAILRRH